MNIKVTAFTLGEKSINTWIVIKFVKTKHNTVNHLIFRASKFDDFKI